MYLFYLSISIILSILIAFSILVLYSVEADVVGNFKYTNQKLSYNVGKSIIPNKPVVEGSGIYKVDPKLPTGIELDPKTGIISGVAKEKYVNNHEITFKREDGRVLKAELDIEVNEEPPKVDCGITKLVLYSSLTEDITCKCTKTVSRWEPEYNPNTVSSVNLVEGVLKFDNYQPEGDLEITIKAYNDKNELIALTVISVIKGNGEYIDGLSVIAKHTGSSSCKNRNSYFKEMYEGVVDNLDGIDIDNGLNGWDEKLVGFVSSYYVEYLELNLKGLMNIETDGKYTFVIQSDNSKFNVIIDNNKVYEQKESIGNDFEDGVERTSTCAVWNYSKNSFEVELTSGNHEVEIDGYYFNKNEMCQGNTDDCVKPPATYRFLLKWMKDGVESTIPFQTLPVYSFVSGLAFESDYYTVPTDATTEILFTLERGKATRCNGTFNSENVYVDVFKNVIKVTSNIETSIEFTMSCSTLSSVTNSVNVKIEFINRFVKGIVGYYLKDANFNPALNDPILASNEGVTVVIIKLESSLNHPAVETPTIWDGLTQEFISQFGVNWDGYLYINNDDEYKFNLSSIQASWLYIDYRIIIDNSGKVLHMYTKYGTATLTKGYHFIRVVYSKDSGPSGILLSSILKKMIVNIKI